MKQYLIYTLCPECDTITFYTKETPIDEIPAVCHQCNNDRLELVTDDDIVIQDDGFIGYAARKPHVRKFKRKKKVELKHTPEIDQMTLPF